MNNLHKIRPTYSTRLLAVLDWFFARPHTYDVKIEANEILYRARGSTTVWHKALIRDMSWSYVEKHWKDMGSPMPDFSELYHE